MVPGKLKNPARSDRLEIPGPGPGHGNENNRRQEKPNQPEDSCVIPLHGRIVYCKE
jgi:hypothetical protein